MSRAMRDLVFETIFVIACWAIIALGLAIGA